MTKEMWAIFIAFSLLLSIGIGWATGQLEITAPGGGEFDLRQNVMKYHGQDSQQVNVRWNDSALETNELQGKEQNKGTRKVIPRLLRAFELTANLNQNYIVASKEVSLLYDESTTATCNLLEWDRQTAFMRLSGQVMIVYKDWTIKGIRIEGQLDKELFTVFGPLEASNKLNTIRGGKLIFNRRMERLIVEDNPLLIRGNNEMAASKIVYSINTNQVEASGMVKTRIIDETK